ncbi:MAG TPA: HAMP domain-containing sensor histidine kinase [Polyangiaceae bacterium]
MKPANQCQFDQLQWQILEKRVRKFNRARSVLAPVIWGFILLTLWGDAPLWRRIILGGIVALGIVGVIVHTLRPELRPQVGPNAPWASERIFRRTMSGSMVLGVLILATGGFDGPLLPVAIPLVFFIGSVGNKRALVSTVVSSAVMVLAMAVISQKGWVADALPVIFGGGPNVPQSPVLVYAKAGVMVVLLVWAASMADLVRTTFRETLEQGLKAKDEFLEGHEAHARELTALTGELAHELKNPLASIKGLAILIGRDVKEGRAAERLTVLKEEVDRMEQTLQSILTFSRPLLPLNQSEVDLSELSTSVLAMHEGLASMGQVTLVLLAPAPVVVRCDARKIKQVLINLLQNALEVSSPGTHVEIAVARAPDGGARLEVRDEGPGISPRVRERLFEPGVTDKEQGSGLGLALARGLVRQHGGELSLVNRDGGGCTATLRLPERVPANEGAAA